MASSEPVSGVRIRGVMLPDCRGGKAGLSLVLQVPSGVRKDISLLGAAVRTRVRSEGSVTPDQLLAGVKSPGTCPAAFTSSVPSLAQHRGTAPFTFSSTRHRDPAPNAGRGGHGHRGKLWIVVATGQRKHQGQFCSLGAWGRALPPCSGGSREGKPTAASSKEAGAC